MQELPPRAAQLENQEDSEAAAVVVGDGVASNEIKTAVEPKHERKFNICKLQLNNTNLHLMVHPPIKSIFLLSLPRDVVGGYGLLLHFTIPLQCCSGWGKSKASLESFYWHLFLFCTSLFVPLLSSFTAVLFYFQKTINGCCLSLQP